ncbi:MAG: ligase-associated DNA damage response exonuclease [Leptolyngbyaceae cyanobacterium SM2_5_2]|nr:ligase-associated DNA damage response exonuclease [Leptolyngbyaceae cyanobacterium SM2_5_2]
MALITVRPEGLYCEKGNFYIDPWHSVETALITHAHSDHARAGSAHYMATARSEGILRRRLGQEMRLQGVAYGEKLRLGETWVSFHPAGHVLGSAQIRVEHRGEVWVVSGDYKRCADPSCDPFEVVPCNTFITEATFGLPIYRWDSGPVTVGGIYNWWQADPERPSILFCYAFGKAQRVLSELTRFTDRPVYVHGAIHALTEIYRTQGIPMVPTICTFDMPRNHKYTGDLVLAPPSGHRSSWMKRFKQPQTAFASGWMAVRGARRRRSYERGFVLSDHADWPGLLQTVQDTGASQIYVTHGQSDVLSRYLQETLHLNAMPLNTLFEGEGDI